MEIREMRRKYQHHERECGQLGGDGVKEDLSYRLGIILHTILREPTAGYPDETVMEGGSVYYQAQSCRER